MAENEKQSRKRWRFRFGLSTFLLAVAAISVWILFYQSRLKEPEIQRSLNNLKLAARDLFIIDENKFAAAKKYAYGNDHCWRVYLPESPGAQYRLRVANDDIPNPSRKGVVHLSPLTKSDLPTSCVTDIELVPGRHEIGVIIPYERKSRTRGSVTDIQLLLDGVETASVSVPGSITVFFGSPLNDVSHSVQQSTNEPLVLTRNIDRYSNAGRRGRGFMMLIERVDPERP